MIRITIPEKSWIVCVDYTIARLLLVRVGYRLRRLDADRLGVYFQPPGTDMNDPNAWEKPTMPLSEIEADKTLLAGTLDVDEGGYDNTILPNGTVGTSWRAQELVAGSKLMLLIVRAILQDRNWFPPTSGAIGRKRQDSELWTGAFEELCKYPDWLEALRIVLTPYEGWGQDMSCTMMIGDKTGVIMSKSQPMTVNDHDVSPQEFWEQGWWVLHMKPDEATGLKKVRMQPNQWRRFAAWLGETIVSYE